MRLGTQVRLRTYHPRYRSLHGEEGVVTAKFSRGRMVVSFGLREVWAYEDELAPGEEKCMEKM